MIFRFYLITFFLTIIRKCSTIQQRQTSSSSAGATTAHFTSEILPNEFIVHFDKYYWPPARKKYLLSALENENLTTKKWSINARQNPANGYPSDFEILSIENVTFAVLSQIQRNPFIKYISSHRKVRRKFNTIDNNETKHFVGRHLLRVVPRQVYEAVGAATLWNIGVTGREIKVAIFDTGLPKNHPHFRNVKERTNWTNEKSLEDGVSHGTFVAGIIASQQDCKGIAPDSELHIYRVFTNSQVSYTSWFLDAFNYAIFKKINVLNLSIGGPDFLDQPFVDKVLELSANKVIMVSAIGNDGPLYGTLNNPGDQSDVIGVGGINFEDKVAKFSSRGMTTWELDWGYGRLKPDIVTYGSQVKGSNVRGGCRALSGTSVASPIVAGAIALIMSGATDKTELINPASVKQILIEGATRLSDNNMFEQGHGKLDIMKSMELLMKYEPKVTLSPSYVDFTESYMWPYSSQQLFCGSMPIVVNVTILNGIAVSSNIAGTPLWYGLKDSHGEHLDVAISYSSLLWPWSGWMAIHLRVKKSGCNFEGLSKGFVRLEVQSPSVQDGITTILNTSIDFPITVKIIPKPPRHKRILWDQFHSLRYPPGYVPRDNLKTKADPLDWRADHIHTNFRDMYTHLRNSGYYIDVLREPFTCLNASEYGTLLVVDPEEEFFDEEITKLYSDVYNSGLSVIVFADWYNTTVMKKIKFFDENTRQWWIPDTGGSNIPALNELLKPFGIAFGDLVAEGFYRLGDHEMYYASGTNIVEFPKSEESENILIGKTLNDQGAKVLDDNKSPTNTIERFIPILGMLQTQKTLKSKYLKENLKESFPANYDDNDVDQSDAEHELSLEKNPLINKRILLASRMKDLEKHFQEEIKNAEEIKAKKLHLSMTPLEGRIAVFGDSNCLDSTHLEKACYWLLDALLEYTTTGYKTELLKNLNMISKFESPSKNPLPLRMAGSNLHRYSKVLEADNKFKKRQLPQCEIPQWSKEILVASSMMRISGEAKQKSEDFDLIKMLKLRLKNLQAEQQSKYPVGGGTKGASSFDDDFMKISLFFIVLLTFLVLLFFIKWSRRKKWMPIIP